MDRKMLLSLMLVTAGAVVYWNASGGPLRVRIITLPVHITYLLAVAWVAWGLKLKPFTRWAAIAAVVILGSLGVTFVDSFVIMALRPLTSAAMAFALVGHALEVALFLISTVAIEVAIRHFRPAMR